MRSDARDGWCFLMTTGAALFVGAMVSATPIGRALVATAGAFLLLGSMLVIRHLDESAVRERNI